MRARQTVGVFRAFSLVEVVLAMGIVSFSVLATVGLLSVANDTQKKARDEGLAARLAANEFERLRSLSSSAAPWTTTPPAYATRYFDSNLADLGTTKTAAAVYEFSVQFSSAPSGTADQLLNAEVRYPAQALPANQNVFRFTSLTNIPIP